MNWRDRSTDYWTLLSSILFDREVAYFRLNKQCTLAYKIQTLFYIGSVLQLYRNKWSLPHVVAYVVQSAFLATATLLVMTLLGYRGVSHFRPTTNAALVISDCPFSMVLRSYIFLVRQTARLLTSPTKEFHDVILRTEAFSCCKDILVCGWLPRPKLEDWLAL